MSDVKFELSVVNQQFSVVVPAVVAGRHVDYIIDTGASDSTITPEAAASFNLRAVGEKLVNGRSRRIFHLPPYQVGYLYGGKGGQEDVAEVAELENPGADKYGRRPIGALGFEMLYNLDYDFDLKRNLVFQSDPDQECLSATAPWTADAIKFDFGVGKRQVIVPIQMDGVHLSALVDTGSPVTIAGSLAMKKLGLEEKDFSRDPQGSLSGSGRDVTTVHIHPFRQLKVNEVDFGPLDVAIGNISYLKDADVLLGLDFLRQHRFAVSFSRHLFWLKSG